MSATGTGFDNEMKNCLREHAMGAISAMHADGFCDATL